MERFEAVRLPGEGWVVLSPWIRAVDGAEYRQHVGDFGNGRGAEQAARHLSEELNDLLTPRPLPE